MKTQISIALLSLIALSGCGTGSTALSEEYSEGGTIGSTSAATQHVVSHNQGMACLSCHGSNSYYAPGRTSYRDNDEGDENEHESNENENEHESDDTDESFTSGATVYKSLHGISSSEYASNYTIRLVLQYTNDVVNYISGRGTGNSHTSYGNSINSYTAQVLDGNKNVVNASIANSHGVDRLDCNRCHTAQGAEGAPGRIVAYNYYAQSGESSSSAATVTPTPTPTPLPTPTTPQVSFAADVMPVLSNSCQACHGGSGRLRITDSASTYNNIISNGFVNTANPAGSLLLSKASGNAHGGGTVISTTSSGYTTIKEWITQGATQN